VPPLRHYDFDPAVIRQIVERTTMEQGLPRYLEDAQALRAIATILSGAKAR